MQDIKLDARNDCYHALADAASEKAKWELSELDFQIAWEWTRRELSLIVSSIKLEGILRRRMEECSATVAEKREDGQLKEWMRSEFVIGQRQRLEKEKGEAKERMEKARKSASERAEKEGRQWWDQGSYTWGVGMNFIDKQWSAGIEGGDSALKNAVSALNELAPKFSRMAAGSQGGRIRLTFAEQVRKRFEYWHPQRENERQEMDATIQRINDADSLHLDGVYHYPETDFGVIRRFVDLVKKPLRKVYSATVYDVQSCDDKADICDVIEKSTTRSVINVDPDLVHFIPENEHLLYLSSSSGKEPEFIQRNRDRWWDQQRSNSSTFYFSPQF